MFYHGVLITVSNKHLVIVKISFNIYIRSDCFKGSKLILFPSEFSGNKLKLTRFSREACSDLAGNGLNVTWPQSQNESR